MFSWSPFISIILAQSDIAVGASEAAAVLSKALPCGLKPPRTIANAAKTMMSFLITASF